MDILYRLLNLVILVMIFFWLLLLWFYWKDGFDDEVLELMLLLLSLGLFLLVVWERIDGVVGRIGVVRKCIFFGVGKWLFMGESYCLIFLIEGLFFFFFEVNEFFECFGFFIIGLSVCVGFC